MCANESLLRISENPDRTDRNPLPSRLRQTFLQVLSGCCLPIVITFTVHAQPLGDAANSVGAADETGSAARFYGPRGVAVDSGGNVYVADYFSHTVRRVTPSGTVTTLAGLVGHPGSSDGAGSSARFNQPSGVATDSSGNIYVADEGNHTIRKISPLGDVTTLAGSVGNSDSVDGTGGAARFKGPAGVATDSGGNVYVADFTTIRKITPSGTVTTLAGLAGRPGSMDGAGSTARFSSAEAVATDSAGNVYVAQTFNNMIRKITPAGVVTTLAGKPGMLLGSGSADGTGSAARFDSPAGVATDNGGNVYVADWNNATIRKITPAGVVTTFAGSPSPPKNRAGGRCCNTDGIGSAARFAGPFGVATDGDGNVYVADTFSNTIRKITPAGVVTTLAGSPSSPTTR